MDEHDIERMLPGWQVTSAAVARELVAWRGSSASQLDANRGRGVRSYATSAGASAQAGRPGQRGGRRGGTAGCRATDVSDV